MQLIHPGDANNFLQQKEFVDSGKAGNYPEGWGKKAG